MIVELALLLAGLAVACAIWDLVRDHVRDWLHEQGLEKSAFMDAFVLFEGLMNGIVRLTYHVRVKRWLVGPRAAETRTVTLERHQIDDQDVLRELDRQGSSTRDVLALMD